MAKISLRAYNREIDSLIDQAHYDQAIAHCRHILSYYNKHINTYRLLGKAYLESQRYGDAADIFQRVLSTIPDDFISNVGMSIIREDEGNLDEAIWHMERAYEVQPANGAIQRELRRLYGRRDGIEPPKIRLTRGALARMYIKGELYPQAIAELRSAHNELKQRPDLILLLAQAYFQSGQRVEAAEACSKVIKKLPLCYEANLILAMILSDTERSDQAQDYFQRIYTLDPYAAHTSSNAPTSDKVPDTAVLLEKLEWVPGKPLAGLPEQPEWATSLGVDIQVEGSSSDTLPEWLADVSPIATGDEDTISLEGNDDKKDEFDEAKATDLIPSWMKQAGWEPSTEGSGSELSTLGEEKDLIPDDLAPAEIPDWLQNIAPLEAEIEGESSIETGALPWLDDSASSEADSVALWLEEEPPPIPDEAQLDLGEAEQVDVPDWLKDLDKDSYQEIAEEIDQEEDYTLTESGLDIPVAELEESPIETELASSELDEPTLIESEEQTPEWMAEKEVKTESESDQEAPDWIHGGMAAVGMAGSILASLGDDETEKTSTEPESELPIPDSDQPDVLEDDEAFAWLEGLAAKQGVSEAMILSPEERKETAPEWVLESEEAESILAKDESLQVEEVEFIADKHSPEMPDWLIDEESQAQPSQVGRADESEELPDWLVEPSVDVVGDEISSLTAFESTVDSDAESDLVSEDIQPKDLQEWLQVSGKETFDEAEMITTAGMAELPDWLRDVSPEPVEMKLSDDQEMITEEIVEELEAPLAIEESPSLEEDTKPTWIGPPEELSVPEISDLPDEAEVSDIQITASSEVEPAFDIPEWLQDIWVEEETIPEDMPAAELSSVEAGMREFEIEEIVDESVDYQAITDILEDELPSDLEEEVEEIEPTKAAIGDQAPIAEPEATMAELDDEEAFAWLEGLAAKQGVEEALILETEERRDQPPEWVLETIEEPSEETLVPVDSELETALETITEGDDQPELPEDQEVVIIEVLPKEGEETTAETPLFIEAVAEEEIIAAEVELEEPMEESLQPEIAQPSEELPELPAWMADMEGETEQIEEPLWIPESEAIEKLEWQEIQTEAPTRLNLNEAGLADLERLPGIGFVKAQAILEFREDRGPFTTLDDLENVSGIGPALIDEIRDLVTVDLEEAESAEQFADEYQMMLIKGRNALTQGETVQALENYLALIQAEKCLPDVVHDLNEALYRFPMDILFWQALGDAYFRLKQLQSALDAYTKAEELLR